MHTAFLRKTNTLALLIFALTFLFISCSKGRPDEKAHDKKIISFSLKKPDGSAFDLSLLKVVVQDSVITVTVPFNTDLTRLTPEIEILGVKISPASGVTQDFTTPVVYTVTAEDGTTTRYVVTVIRDNPGSIVYVGSSDNNFYALDALTGQLKWKYSSVASFAYSSATYANGVVFVGGIDNYVYAFDALTGAVKWKKQLALTGIESDAVVVDGTVYVGTNDDYLYALNAATGEVKWQFLTGANVSSSPTVNNGIVYFGSSDGKLYALNAATGTPKWSYATGGMLNQSGPALYNGAVYVGSRDGYLYAVNASDGSLKWKFSANGVSLEQSSPTISNGIVYIGAWYSIAGFNEKGSLYAVDAGTGQLVWESLKNTGISSSPTVANGVVYITTDDMNLHAVDAVTGNGRWQQQILANSASPAVSNGIVYVGGGGTHNFYAFDAAAGTEKWRFPLTGLMTSCPLIVTVNGQADYAGDSGLLN